MLGVLSFATDLASGVPLETSLRTALFAAELARASGASNTDISDAFYTALLRHLGCTAYSVEVAAAGAGEDQALLGAIETSEPSPQQHDQFQALAHAQCDQATALATDLRLSPAIPRALSRIYERFDGSGAPGGLRGEAIELPARILHVATTAEIHHRHGGRNAAIEQLTRRSGTALDPALAACVLKSGAAYWSILETPSIWERYLDAEPEQRLADDHLDDAALAFARYSDLKSPFRIGHSEKVAQLAEAGAALEGLDRDLLRRAALLHDLGIVSVPNGILDKRGVLNDAEWERVRLHAYYTERILDRVPAFQGAAAIARGHHERTDGTGYPHRSPGAALPQAVRLLAAADVYAALAAPRAHRDALSARQSTRVLEAEVRTGRLCGRAVEVVRAAAERGPIKRPNHLLTPREVEVLITVARGLTNKEAAARLEISPRTVQHHLEHIYEKLGVSTRAAAALYAARNGLV